MTVPLLLVGPEAEALAPRLALSGYRPLRLQAEQAMPVPILLDIAMEAGSPAAPVPPSASSRPSPPATALQSPTPVCPDSGTIQPLGVVLSPGKEGCIAGLRRIWGSLPILLGLDADSVEGRSHTLLSGADDFWLTGLGPSDLLTRLRLHRQLPAVGPPCLELGDLRLFPASRRVQRGGRDLAFTSREYQLLLLLLEHRGQVLSREQIQARVWPDQQQGGASNVIEVYVRYLRQKLEQGGARRLIHTVRGRGYCLSEGLPSPADPH